MRRFTTELLLGAVLLAGGVIAAGGASAKPQTRHYHHPHYVNTVFNAQPPLTVNKRSFLDPGPVVPVGSESAYVLQSTYFGGTSDQNFARSKFGNEALPQPLEVPGRSAPIFEFETPRDPF